MYCAVAKDGKPYDPLNTSCALHIETEEANAPTIIQKAEQTYGHLSKQVENYQLGNNVINDVATTDTATRRET